MHQRTRKIEVVQNTGFGSEQHPWSVKIHNNEHQTTVVDLTLAELVNLREAMWPIVREHGVGDQS